MRANFQGLLTTQTEIQAACIELFDLRLAELLEGDEDQIRDHRVMVLAQQVARQIGLGTGALTFWINIAAANAAKVLDAGLGVVDADPELDPAEALMGRIRAGVALTLEHLESELEQRSAEMGDALDMDKPEPEHQPVTRELVAAKVVRVEYDPRCGHGVIVVRDTLSGLEFAMPCERVDPGGSGGN